MTNMPMAVLLSTTPKMLFQLFFTSPQEAYRTTHLTTYKGNKLWCCGANIMEILTQQSKTLIAPIMLVRGYDVHSVFIILLPTYSTIYSSNWYAIN